MRELSYFHEYNNIKYINKKRIFPYINRGLKAFDEALEN